ncbi:unnamed protein product [Polarella glacialis]|uniref:Uncharacterized protein n=1 Tax=Polarella glacialis TaxID=89957 RepID=A0A813EVI1_POLGL|nr:unnamed protein product [Polarella glacialis]
MQSLNIKKTIRYHDSERKACAHLKFLIFETTAVHWDSNQNEQGKSCPNASKLYKCTLAMHVEARACCPHPASVSRAAPWKLPVALQGVLAHGNANAQEKGVGSVALTRLRKRYNVAAWLNLY